MNEHPTQLEMRLLFEYCSSGSLVPRASSGRRGPKRCSNRTTGLRYRRIWVGGRLYMLHRLIYIWHYGAVPNFIDHVDGNAFNNRIENLRPATVSENSRNRKKRRDARWRFKGVRPSHGSRWRAQIRVADKYINLGSFSSEVEAALAYDEAAKANFGAFAKLNFTERDKVK